MAGRITQVDTHDLNLGARLAVGVQKIEAA